MVRISSQFGRLILLAVISIWHSALPAFGQTAPQQRGTGFVLKSFQDEQGAHKYSVFVPHGYTPTKKWPLIVFLHGAGERGSDGLLPTTYGLGPLVKERSGNFPFIVVFPQSEEMRGRILTGWTPSSADGTRALKILDQVEKDYSVDVKREIVTGWSMGGYGAWEWGAAFPNRWLAVVPISGGGDVAWADKLKDSNIWAWHGALDRGVRPEQSRKMVEAIKGAGGNPRLSDVVDGDHNIWLQAYGDDSLYAWMLSPKSDPTKLKPVTSRNKEAIAAPLTVGTALPFVPALDMSHAGYVRLGNEALGTIADTIPKIVPATMLTGRLADISDYTESDGYGFSVYMSGISYRAELTRSVIKTSKPGHLIVQLGLSNAHISIGGTSLNGDRHSAQAGPISIVIGHVRPVWLTIDVTPVVVNRKLRFKLNGSRFSIPNDNWYVTAPAGVSTQGFGMTEGKVSNGLTSGLYGRKGMIEQKVEGIVPNLIVELEKKLDEALTSKSVGGAWPLPVYQPQLRVWPIEVSTDEQGITLVMGATAGAVDFTKPPKSVRTVDLGGPKADKIPQLSKLQLGLVPGMIGPLSEMAVEADVFRIHVADTPSPVLAKLADLAVLADAIPDLKRFNDKVEIWTELAVTARIIVADNEGAYPALSTKGLKLRVLTRPNGSVEVWKPYAEFEVALKQSFSPKLVRPSSLTRAVALTPEGGVAVEVSGTFSADYAPQDSQIDLAKIQSLFTELHRRRNHKTAMGK